MASQSNGQKRSITIQNQGAGHSSTLTLTGDILRVRREEWKDIQVPVRNVVWSEYVDGKLEVSVLAKRGKNASFSLVRLTTAVDEAQREAVTEFVDALTKLSYRGPQKPRRLKVLINPHSGPGKAPLLFKRKVEPLFRAARCELDITYTTRRNHAADLMQDIPLGTYDAVVVISGDGLIHEVLNGFAQHKNPLAAFRIPVAPIPAGSGNALALNLLGLEEGVDVSTAALNAVKGRAIPFDLFSFVQKDTRVFSFFSQCVGLMAELDLWTEHLRFLGSGRFVVGYLTGIIKRKACPVKIHIKVGQSDKDAIYKTFREERAKALEASHREIDDSSEEDPIPSESTIPPLRYVSVKPEEEEGWISFEKATSFFYAGNGPYVSVDLMQFPAALPGDGYIDVVIHEQVSRGKMLSAMDEASAGAGFWLPEQHYFKAEAYRIEPLSTNSCLSVDGEGFDFEPFHVEVHKGLARVLSPYGYYNADFFPKSSPS
ncbi:ATP-NAD kinase-like domain-containing protein [Cristinia sonorae]|uniref:ATP-NAD kinase-like domain-containing protein n=1 Tax=Cristinia sonorae TaxID=1940300 RepID=A0A8K0UXC7_9AGAR|nr:ATP-NAD kinase-like domain-containing protein [Cristinia sonorae]